MMGRPLRRGGSSISAAENIERAALGSLLRPSAGLGVSLTTIGHAKHVYDTAFEALAQLGGDLGTRLR